jgi:hypothetical protein
MEGRLSYTNNRWVVSYSKCIPGRMTKEWGYELPLHPTNVQLFNEWALVFDNVEARILTSPHVNFEIVDECAKLIL